MAPPPSSPASPLTPPTTCCSGFWRASGKAGTSLTGEPLGVSLYSVTPWRTRRRTCASSSCCSNQNAKKSFGGSAAAQTHTWGGGGSCGHLRNHQPAQPFIQDPAMPPLPPPNTLAQLEEACRRLEEVSTKPTKPR